MNTLVLNTQLAALIGVVSPFLIAMVQQPGWTPRHRSIVTIVTSIILGFGSALTAGQIDSIRLTPIGVLSSMSVVWVAAQAAYEGLKKTGITAAIENATSPKPPLPPAAADVPVPVIAPTADVVAPAVTVPVDVPVSGTPPAVVPDAPVPAPVVAPTDASPSTPVTP